MRAVTENLQNKFNLEIVSPFILEVENKTIKFFCLIKGYGATKGMIIDSNWEKIEPVSGLLIELGYGFSCFTIIQFYVIDCNILSLFEIQDSASVTARPPSEQSWAELIIPASIASREAF